MSDPKLLQARDRIRAILDELDIAGHVVLHNAPGQIELFYKIDPSYSKLIGEMPVVRLRSKLADYQGDADAQRRDLEATANMVSSIAEMLDNSAADFQQLAAWIDNELGAEHTPMERDDDTVPPDLLRDALAALDAELVALAAGCMDPSNHRLFSEAVAALAARHDKEG